MRGFYFNLRTRATDSMYTKKDSTESETDKEFHPREDTKNSVHWAIGPAAQGRIVCKEHCQVAGGAVLNDLIRKADKELIQNSYRSFKTLASSRLLHVLGVLPADTLTVANLPAHFDAWSNDSSSKCRCRSLRVSQLRTVLSA